MRWIVAALVGVAFVGCGGGDGTGPSSDAEVGTYTLQTVQGESLPFIMVQNVSGTVSVTGGQITLNADHSFSDVTNLLVSANSTNGTDVEDQKVELTGRYERDGATVRLIPTDAAEYTVTLSGSKLTKNFAGEVRVYQRQ